MLAAMQLAQTQYTHTGKEGKRSPEVRTAFLLSDGNCSDYVASKIDREEGSRPG